MKVVTAQHCSHCGGDDHLIKYTKNKKGIQYFYCRECNREKMRKYYKTKNGALRVKASVYRSIKKYPYKQRARELLNQAVIKGIILRPAKCSKCGKKGRIEGHHTDYSKPLEVLWLCRTCHCAV